MIIPKCHHVACNIYLSAGQPVYRAVLERLLQEAQQEQGTLRSAVTLVHAFADTQYDRTSFHLAGSPWAIATLATSITINAMQVLAPLKQQQQHAKNGELEHPTVGIVDHISILPLNGNDDTEKAVPKMTWDEWRDYYNGNIQTTTTAKQQRNLPDSSPQQQDESSSSSSKMMMPTTTIASGWVAWTIGRNLKEQKLPVDVLYYGHAHPTNMPLAQVRREQTNFFRSSRSSDDTSNNVGQKMGQCTIGAPPHFVENYNLRLTHKCSKPVARSLTKFVREKDGGLPFVEALTLPYGGPDRFEVACNLLHLQVSSSQDVDARVAQFFQDKPGGHCIEECLEVAYRVGTTEQQCLQAIHDCQSFTSMEQLEEQDEVVRERFRACFVDPPPAPPNG